MCDKKCRVKRGTIFLMLVAMVMEEGSAAHTINLGRNCFCERRAKEGKAAVNGVMWKVLVTQRSSRGKLWESFRCG